MYVKLFSFLLLSFVVACEKMEQQLQQNVSLKITPTPVPMDLRDLPEPSFPPQKKTSEKAKILTSTPVQNPETTPTILPIILPVEPTPKQRPTPTATPSHKVRLSKVLLAEMAPNSVPLGTFNSHNSLVVPVEGVGVFVSYLSSSDANNFYAHWKIDFSSDGIKFNTILSGIDRTRPPSIVADLSGNLYVIVQEWNDASATGNAALYVLKRSQNYLPSGKIIIQGGASGKYTALYLPAKNRILYLTWSNLFTIHLPSCTIQQKPFFVPGYYSYPQYPLLTSPDGSLVYAGWTTVRIAGSYQDYLSNHLLASWDGGDSWGKPIPNGMVTLPVQVDNPNTSVQITLPQDFAKGLAASASKPYGNWLENIIFGACEVHAIYSSRPSWELRHVTMNHCGLTAQVSYLNLKVGADNQRLTGNGSFFTGTPYLSKLYLTGASLNDKNEWTLATLESNDRGRSWSTLSRSEILEKPIYATGGANKLWNGKVVGVYTEITKPAKIWFFQVDTSP